MQACPACCQRLCYAAKISSHPCPMPSGASWRGSLSLRPMLQGVINHSYAICKKLALKIIASSTIITTAITITTATTTPTTVLLDPSLCLHTFSDCECLLGPHACTNLLGSILSPLGHMNDNGGATSSPT